MSSGSLEQKINWLVDRAEIEQLISSYSNTIDDRDYAAWKDLFTDDGGYGSGSDRISKDQLEKAGRDLLSSYEKTHHFFGLPEIKINGDEAEARCPGVTHHIKVQAHPSQSSIVGGWLRLTFRRTESGWRIVNAFAETAFTEGGDYFAGAAKVVEQLVGE